MFQFLRNPLNFGGLKVGYSVGLAGIQATTGEN
jgi:hypothetical protein